jgi:hypothetical protein
MRHKRAVVVAALGAAIGTGVSVGAAGAAPTAVDVQLDIGAATQRGQNLPLIPNGGTVTVTRLNFVAGTVAELITSQPAAVKVRLELAPGLSWGSDLPDPTEDCTSTPTSGECQTPALQPITGQTGWGWQWDVVAERAGSYVIRSAIIEASEPDPDQSNNSSSITVVVAPSGGPGGGGGGGTAAVVAGGVKLAPAKPTAGATFVASVRVTRGGSPVRPAGVTCSGSIGKAKVKGAPKAASGIASCRFKTPKSAKGKALAGTMSFRAGGQRFTKRFTARLR